MGNSRLADLVGSKLDELIGTDKSADYTKSAWVYGPEGNAYIRFQPLFNRADLANLELLDDDDEPRVMVEIVNEMAARPVEVLRVETVTLPGTVMRLSQLKTTGRNTLVNCANHSHAKSDLDVIAQCMNGRGCCATIEFGRV